MKKKIFPSIVLYVFAGLLLIYAVWAFTNCMKVVSQAKAAGQLIVSGNEYEIMNFFMSSCAVYVVYALLLLAAGLLLQKKQPVAGIPVAGVPVVAEPIVINNEADDELDEPIDRMDSEEDTEYEEDTE